jgi:nucleotide-binding universal stress UspA family protein
MKTIKSSKSVEAEQILVPIDFSGSSAPALRHAAVLAAGGRAQVTLLNVMEEEPSFRRLDHAAEERQRHNDRASRLSELARQELGTGIRANVVVLKGRPVTEIKRLAVKIHSDLIVMGRHAHGGLRRWFRKHTADHVAAGVPCPVVTLRGAGKLECDQPVA